MMEGDVWAELADGSWAWAGEAATFDPEALFAAHACYRRLVVRKPHGGRRIAEYGREEFDAPELTQPMPVSSP